MLHIENPKNLKIDFSYCTGGTDKTGKSLFLIRKYFLIIAL
jgi:hypothetical protein